MNINLLLQKQLISALLTENRIAEYQDLLDDEYFSQEDCKWFFCKILDFYKKNGIAPTNDNFTVIILDDFKDKEQQQIKLNLLKEFSELQIQKNEIPFLVEKLKKHYLLRKLHSSLEDVMVDISADNIEDKYLELRSRLENNLVKATDANITREDMGPLTCVKAYIDKSKLDETGIKSGIAKLDELTGGWRKGELIFIAAPSGEGKSAVLLNFSRNAFLQGANVLYVTLELGRDEVLERYTALVSQLSYQNIRNKTLSSSSFAQLLFKNLKEFVDESEIKLFTDKFKTEFKNLTNLIAINNFMSSFKKRPNKLNVVDIPRNCTLKLLERELLKALNRGKVDILVLDHYNLLVADRWTKDYWLDIGNMARELKGIAKQYNIPILTAVQLKFMKEGEEMSPEHVKYSQMIVHNADFVMAFSRSQEDKILQRICIELLKHRSTKKETIMLREDFEKMSLGDYIEGADVI